MGRKVMKRLALLSIMLMLFVCANHAQTVTIDDVIQEGQNITITFSLKEKNSPEELYEISVYSSVDNYQSSLPIESGQTKDLNPGSRFRIIIDGPSNFAGYQGNINFQVGAEITSSPIFVRLNQSSVKRGNNLPITFGGDSAEGYQLELYQNDVRVSGIASNLRKTNYGWKLSQDQSIGSNYKIRISTTSGRVFSQPFTIKRKIPLGLKILPIAVVGGVVGLLTGGGDGDDNTQEELPRPDLPPN